MAEQNVPNLVINKVESQEVYDAMATAGEINANELYLVAGDSGGGLVVQTEYYDGGQYRKGFKSDVDADDIVDAFKAGKTVRFHIPHTNYTPYGTVDEQWLTLINYTDEYGSQWGNPEERYEFYYKNVMSWSNDGVYRTQDGKLVLIVYDDS